MQLTINEKDFEIITNCRFYYRNIQQNLNKTRQNKAAKNEYNKKCVRCLSACLFLFTFFFVLLNTFNWLKPYERKSFEKPEKVSDHVWFTL